MPMADPNKGPPLSPLLPTGPLPLFTSCREQWGSRKPSLRQCQV